MLTLGNKLTLNSQPIYKFVNKYSVDFDGVDDRIVTDGADTVAQPTTYSFWCKSSTTGENRGVFGHGADRQGGFHFNYLQGGAYKPLLWLGSNLFVFWNDISQQDDGEWHHWVVYSDPNDITNSKLYVDGVLQTVSLTYTSGSLDAYTESLTIGSDRQVGGNSFEGKIDEFAVYDRELTQAEITRMYNTYYSPNRVANGNFSQIGNEEVTNGDFSQIGSEEVTNGDFSQIGSELLSQPVDLQTDFTAVNGASFTDANTLVTTGGSIEGFTKTSFLTLGKTYKLIIAGTTTSSGFTLGNTTGSGNEYGSGFGTHYFTASGNTAFWLRQNTAGTTNITSFSIKEVVGWVFESSWSIIGDKANYDAVTSQHYLKQTMSSIAAGKTVKIQFDISDVEAGKNAFFKLEISGTPEVVFTYTTFTEGTYTYYHKITGGLDRLNFVPATSGTGGSFSIDNISVKEVGQDWEFNGESELTPQGSRVLSTAGSQSFVKQNSILVIGKSYKVTFDVISTDGTNLVDNSGNSWGTSTTGAKTIYYTATGDFLMFKRGGVTDVTITNISVKEVGQHWTFGTGWSTDGTKAISAGSNEDAYLSQSGIVPGRTYKVTFDVNDYTSGALSVRAVNEASALSVTATGSYEVSITPISNISIGFRSAGGAGGYVGSIDNIVVQELKHDATNLMLNHSEYQSANPLITSTKSMEFDGTDDYLQLGEPFSHTNHTITGWFKTDNIYLGEIFSAADNGIDCIRVFQDSSGYLKYRIGNTSWNTLSSSAIEANKWYNFAATYDGTTQTMYIDGINVASASVAISIDITTNTAIGKISYSDSNYFNGKITEVGAFNRCLTALEVASLYNQGMPTNLLVNRNNYQSGNPTVFNTKQVDFDGTDDYLKVTNNYGSFTGSISMWFKRDNTGNPMYLIDARGDSANGTGYIIVNSSVFTVSSGTRYVDGVAQTTMPTDANWHHMVVTGMTLDIDEDLKIGSRYNQTEELEGNISQVGLFNSTLTADEVSSLYNHGLPIDLTIDQAAYASSSNLVGYWRMGSGTLDTYPLIADQTNATLGSNLVVNGTFETPVDNNQWFNFGSPTTAERSTTRAYAGSYSYHIVGDSTNDGTQAAATQFVGDYTVGDVVKITAYVYPITAYSNQIKTGVANSSRSITSGYTVVLNEWNKIEYYVTITNTSVNYITFLIMGDGVAGEFYLDNVSAEIVQGNPAIMTNQTSSDIENGSPYANIVQDSDFGSSTGWSDYGTVSFGTNQVTIGASSNSGIYQSLLTQGKTYIITTDIIANNGVGEFEISKNNGNVIATYATTGLKTITYTHDIADPIILWRARNNNISTLNSVTVEEVNTGLQGYWKMGDGTNDEYPYIFDQTNPTLGSELITNGDFSDGTNNWTNNGTSTLSVSNGILTIDRNGGGVSNQCYQDLTTVNGSQYILSINQIAASEGIQLNIGGTGYANFPVTLGTRKILFTASSTTTRVSINPSDSTSATAQIDDVSVKLVSGNPATMTNMVEGNITNQYPLTKIRNYYRMGDGILDGYPIIQDQTSPNLAHIPTTNLIVFSEDFNGTANPFYYSKVGGTTVTPNSTIAPDGTNTGTLVTRGTNNLIIRANNVVETNKTYTFSCYVKSSGSGVTTVSIDISDSSVNSFSLTNDWQRITITAEVTNTPQSTFNFVDMAVNGSQNDTFYTWGWQVEEQNQATGYIKSNGIAAVRKSSTTNLLPYSEDFANSAWTKSDSSITSNSTISPDGTQNASTLTTTAAGGTVQDTLTVSDGVVTFSLYVKKGSTNGVRLRIDAATDFNGYFDLTDGTIHTTTGVANIEVINNNWYRVSITGNVTSFVKASVYTTDGTTSYDNGTLFIWAAQLEQQTQAETYAKTTGLPVEIDLFTENNYGTMTNMSASDIVEDTP